MRVLCSSRKPMRKTPVSGFPRALLSLAVMCKRALESRLPMDQEQEEYWCMRISNKPRVKLVLLVVNSPLNCIYLHYRMMKVYQYIFLIMLLYFSVKGVFISCSYGRTL